MKAMLLIVTSLILTSFSSRGVETSGPAQVTLQNNTQYDLYLYVDNTNNLVCGPASASGGFCVASVESGSHVLIVTTTGTRLSASTDPVEFNTGDTKVVTAILGDDGQLKLSVN